MQIRAVTLEDVVRFNGDIDVEIAAGRAPLAGFAQARIAKTRSFLHSWRNLYGHRLLHLAPAAAVTRVARIVDHAAAATAARAHTRGHELPEDRVARRPDLTTAVTLWTRRRRRSVGRASACTRVAAGQVRERDLLFSAVEHFFERHAKVIP